MADVREVKEGTIIECVEGIFGIYKISGDNYYYRELMFAVDDEGRPLNGGIEGVWTAKELRNNKYQIW